MQHKEAVAVTPNKIVYAAFLILILLFSSFDSFGIDGLIPLIQKHFAINDAQTAVIRTTTSIAHTLTLGVMWIVGEMFDRRRMIIFSASLWVLLSLSSITWGANAYWLFIVFRSVASAAAAVFGVLIPVVLADMFRDRALGVALMCLTASEFLSGITSILFASWIVGNDLSWQIGLIPGSVLTIIPLLGVVCVMKETQPASTSVKRHSTMLGASFGLLKIKSYVLLVAALSLSMFYLKAFVFWSASMTLSAWTAFPAVYEGVSYPMMTLAKTAGTVIGNVIGMPLILWFAQSWQFGSGLFSGRPGYSRAFPIFLTAGAVINTAAFIGDISLLDKTFVGSVAAIFMMGLGMAAETTLGQQMLMMMVPPSSRTAALSLSRLITGFLTIPAAQIVGFLSDAFRGDSTTDVDKFYAYQTALLIACLSMVLAVLFEAGLVVCFPADCERADLQDEEAPLVAVQKRSASLVENLVRSRAATIAF